VVAERLRELGLEVRTGVGGHGVVAVLQGGVPGPVVAFRADMDAVASDAPDPVSFASETTGVRHICGHDIHTTVAVGIAEALAAVREELPGTVVLIFQPAEENGTGARAMLGQGAMNDPRPQGVFAVHTHPLEVGQIGVGVGRVLAGRDMATVALSGDGDLQAAAAAVAGVISGITNLDVAAAAAGALIEGEFILGQPLQSVPGTAPDEWVVIGQVTTSGGESQDKAKALIRQGLDALELGEITYSLDYRERSTSGIYNEPALVESSGAVVRQLVADDAFFVTHGTLPFFSEDFGFFQDEAPGVMFWLGVSNSANGTFGLPHSAEYVADEDAIIIGARVMATVLFDFLASYDDSEGRALGAS